MVIYNRCFRPPKNPPLNHPPTTSACYICKTFSHVLHMCLCAFLRNNDLNIFQHHSKNVMSNTKMLVCLWCSFMICSELKWTPYMRFEAYISWKKETPGFEDMQMIKEGWTGACAKHSCYFYIKINSNPSLDLPKRVNMHYLKCWIK